MELRGAAGDMAKEEIEKVVEIEKHVEGAERAQEYMEEQERKHKAEMEAKAKAEAEAKRKAEAEAKAKAEAEAKVQIVIEPVTSLGTSLGQRSF